MKIIFICILLFIFTYCESRNREIKKERIEKCNLNLFLRFMYEGSDFNKTLQNQNLGYPYIYDYSECMKKANEKEAKYAIPD